MKKITMLFILSLLAGGWVSDAPAQVPSVLIVYPNLLIHNGKIVTVDDKTTSTNVGTIVEAMAVRDGKILALGSNQDILALKGPQTQVIDLKGRTVLPGIIDTHSHLQSYAIGHFGWRALAKSRIAIQAEDGETWQSVKRKVLDRIKEEAAQIKPGAWIPVTLPRSALDEDGKPMIVAQAAFGRLITLAEVDEVAPDHPVHIAAGISAVTNTRAQEVIREIWYGPEEPGLLAEDGLSSNTINRIMVTDFLMPDLDTLAEVYKQENFEWAGFGITTWTSSIRSLKVLAGYQLLDKRGEMGIRLAFAPAIGTPIQVIPQLMGVGDGYGSDFIWSIGSSRKAWDESYPGLLTSLEPPTIRQEIKDRETLVMTPERIESYGKFIEDSIASGQRFVNTHMAGDGTLDLTLDAIERGSARAGFSLEEIRAKRHAIDHCTMNPRPDQIPRLKRLGILMSCSPKYIEDTSERVLQDYGERYLTWVTPAKSLIDAGVRTVLEIDTHGIGEYGTVFHFLDLLVNRDVEGRIFARSERVNRVQALKMSTIWAAEYVLREKVLGSLEKGKFADFIVLDKDYLTVETQQIRSIKALLTVVGGEIVHQKEEMGLAASSSLPGD